MKVRHLVAKTGQIDLVGCQQGTQRLLGGEHHAQQVSAGGGRQVGHLADVAVPDHSAEAWIKRGFRARHANHPTMLIGPQDCFILAVTKRAGGHIRHGAAGDIVGSSATF